MLSIIIPTFNCEGSIEAALRSVLSQSYQDWEAIVVDGGSVDSTVLIANSIHDNRIRVFSEPDQGVYDAMNKGIDLAVGEWLYFLGSDDYLLDGQVLERVFSYDTKADILYGDVESSHLRIEYSGEWNVSGIKFNRCHQSIFYKKWLFRRFGKYELKYKILADRAFNLKVFYSRNVKTQYLPLKIAHFSSGGLSSTTRGEVFDQDFSSIVLDNLYWKLNISQKVYFISDYLSRSSHTKKKRLFACILPLLKLEKRCKSLINRLSKMFI